MQTHVVVDRSVYEDAADLLARFGDYALQEAAIRAEGARDRGNAIHFCHWRQTERAIEMLSGAGDSDTIH